MKKRHLITVLLMLISTVLHAQVTVEQADKIVLDYLKIEKNSKDYGVYAFDNTTNTTQVVKSVIDKTISNKNTSLIYFVDEDPFANWSHKCKFLFIDKKTGAISSQSESFPPQKLQDWRRVTEYPKIPEGKKFNFEKSSSFINSANNVNNCYAVILSGGIDQYNNWERYWNDCSAIYQALVNVYGYRKDHIYVLMSDGTDPGIDRHLNNNTYDSSPLDLDGDGTADIQYSATKSSISSVFNTLSGILTQDDFLFIFTTDHGGQTSGEDVYLCLWHENITDAQFAVEVNKVNAGSISVVMEQCFSGGFINDLAKTGRTIATACSAYESSYAMPSRTYNEFVYHWTAAVAKKDPYGAIVNADTDGDGVVSMTEAFNYAKLKDTRSESPQYSSLPIDLGKQLFLLGKICSTTYLTGNFVGVAKTISDCKIEAKNINITNNSKITLQAKQEVLILSSLDTQLGSTFEIKIVN